MATNCRGWVVRTLDKASIYTSLQQLGPTFDNIAIDNMAVRDALRVLRGHIAAPQQPMGLDGPLRDLAATF